MSDRPPGPRSDEEGHAPNKSTASAIRLLLAATLAVAIATVGALGISGSDDSIGLFVGAAASPRPDPEATRSPEPACQASSMASAIIDYISGAEGDETPEEAVRRVADRDLYRYDNIQRTQHDPFGRSGRGEVWVAIRDGKVIASFSVEQADAGGYLVGSYEVCVGEGPYS